MFPGILRPKLNKNHERALSITPYNKIIYMHIYTSCLSMKTFGFRKWIKFLCWCTLQTYRLNGSRFDIRLVFRNEEYFGGFNTREIEICHRFFTKMSISTCICTCGLICDQTWPNSAIYIDLACCNIHALG